MLYAANEIASEQRCRVGGPNAETDTWDNESKSGNKDGIHAERRGVKPPSMKEVEATKKAAEAAAKKSADEKIAAQKEKIEAFEKEVADSCHASTARSCTHRPISACTTEDGHDLTPPQDR